MKRLEIIANRSVQEELIEAIEAAVPAIRYTVLSSAHGRGTDDWKLGTTVWPEENFLWFAYLADDEARAIFAVVADAKARYPREGIRAFSVTADEVL